MKKFALLFAMLLMLGGGAVSALKFLNLGPFQVDEVVEEEAPEEEIDDTVFVDMDPLAIPIFGNNKVAATVQIQIKLETKNKDNAAAIKRLMPLIHDAFIRDMHSFLPRLLKQEERVDVLILKQRLQLIGDKVVGKGLIRNILVQSVIDIPN